AVAISILGRTPLAVRISAAIVGSLTTLVIYGLGKSWFGRQTAVYAAWIWAITLWPIHLSRIGFRTILLPIMLGLVFWIGTEAYRRKSIRLWALAGAVYGLAFYTYLAIRFTPLILILIILFLWWQKRPLPTWQQLGAFVGTGTAVLSPLLLWIAQDPSRFLGRTGQVSVLNPIINGGDLWGTLLGNIGRALGMFVWQGDSILRHNPAGRPVFDWVMLIPFLIGIGICIWQWKRPSMALLLIWTLTMLGPTILAEDTPHFLRAVGILPAIVYFPALGLMGIIGWGRCPELVEGLGTGDRGLGSGDRQKSLSQSPNSSTNITSSPHHFTTATRHHLITLSPFILITLSLFLTVRDYSDYSNDPEVGFLFEAAALELAESLAAEEEGTAVYMDRWFWDEEEGGWPTVPFVAPLENVVDYRPEFSVQPPQATQPVSIYGWQFGSLDFVPTLIQPPAIVNIKTGALARGDLEESSYPLYVNYSVLPIDPNQAPTAQFEDQYRLITAHAGIVENELVVTLWWEAETAVSQPWHVFAHLVGPEGLVAQDDHLPADGRWQFDWWESGLWVQDVHHFDLPEGFDPTIHHVLIGLYDPATGTRLQATDHLGVPQGDSWRIGLGPS
ncbi:MAG: glycosyltransferase family 39 protein, partial [Chloroflexota bacterium]